jgi:hypothetical protein
MGKNRGTGPDKETVAESPDLDAAPGASQQEGSGNGTPDPAKGGCMKFGWGCLPVVAFLLVAPFGLVF